MANVSGATLLAWHRLRLSRTPGVACCLRCGGLSELGHICMLGEPERFGRIRAAASRLAPGRPAKPNA